MADERTGGRPEGVVVGIDIGGTKTALLATDAATGQDIGGDRFETPTEAGPEAMLDRMVDAIATLLAAAGRQPDELAAVGVAVPGLVDTRTGRVKVAGNLEGWVDVPLRDLLDRRLGVSVFVDQDADVAALGEKWRGCARQMDTFVFLALGTGIGAGIMVNGRLHRGFHNAAGELGNLVVGREFLGQERNGVGNLAALVGGKTIRDRAKEIAGEELSAAEVIERARDDPSLAPVAAEVVDHVAMAVIALAAVLDPEAVIFGGGTAEAGALLVEPVRERIAAELPAPPALMHAVLGADAQLHGAVFGALGLLDPDLARREESR
ncbi:MAG: ROK family protein [Chloroflexia bacterium]|nr:ROK family protein [Chloroflexia bacterium]